MAQPYFNPLPRKRENLTVPIIPFSKIDISIHSLVRGRTAGVVYELKEQVAISIHSLVRGRTFKNAGYGWLVIISIHSLVRGRTIKSRLRSTI